MVTKGKITTRESNTNWFIYVLELENQKYYVGIAVDPEQRFIEHQKQQKKCSIWCKKHKAQKIVEVIDTGHRRMIDASFLEDIISLEYIKKYGAANVRGGRYLGSEQKVRKASDCHTKRGYITIMHRFLTELYMTHQEIEKLNLLAFLIDAKNESYLNNLLLVTSKSDNQKKTILRKIQERLNNKSKF